MAKAKKVRLIWWQVALLRKKAERLGLVQAPAGDDAAALATAIKTYAYLTAAEKKRLAVRPNSHPAPKS